jgi:hypothetical protein
VQVNGVPVKAFVDSGAQMTIMTHDFAEKCYLTRLLDKRFAGLAVGVGSSRILGRIHQAPLNVGLALPNSNLFAFKYGTSREVHREQGTADTVAGLYSLFAAVIADLVCTLSQPGRGSTLPNCVDQ